MVGVLSYMVVSIRLPGWSVRLHVRVFVICWVC